MDDRPPSISVVIPAYNASATIDECLQALQGQSVPHSEYEVIVVDDGSTDATGNIASRHGALVFRQANCGPAGARNKGIALARGATVLFTDADCAPAPNWIAEMTAPLADAGIAGVKGVYRTRQRNLLARFVQIEYEDRYDHTARQKYVDFIDTYAAAYRRDVLLAIGGFDPDIRVDEDQELSFRLAEAGHKMVFNPQAIVYHHHSASWRKYLRRKYSFGYWKTLVLRLHPGKAWRDSHTPWNLKLQLPLAAVSAPLAFLSIWNRTWLYLLWITLAAFAATAMPFVVKAWRRDRPVAFLCLPALYLRAWALGLGFAAGNLAALCKRDPASRRTG
jgi:cellulose synthase/poly-beta-1,6-N-acetylglucosamine synthase-like glycosyltransferase